MPWNYPFAVLLTATLLMPQLHAQEKPPARTKTPRAENVEHDLIGVTERRRAAGQPDPITILIDVDKEPLVGSPISLPEIKVLLKNTDIEKKTFSISPTSDYRSGRLPKFRIALTNEQGKELPPRPRFEANGGGILQSYDLKPGETWDTTLNLRGYVEPLLPGKYKLQVLYSDREHLVEEKDISKLVYCRSKVIDFEVRKLPLKISEVDAAVVRRQIEALDGDQPLRIVAGTYGPWAHSFLAKESPAGQLMGVGLPAIPQLVEAVQDKSLKPGKRAWLLSILFSITGQIDPRGDGYFHTGGCLGSYEYIQGPWSFAGGKNGEEEPITFALPSTGSVSGGRTNEKGLAEYAAKWPAWIKTNCDTQTAAK